MKTYEIEFFDRVKSGVSLSYFRESGQKCILGGKIDINKKQGALLSFMMHIAQASKPLEGVEVIIRAESDKSLVALVNNKFPISDIEEKDIAAALVRILDEKSIKIKAKHFAK